MARLRGALANNTVFIVLNRRMRIRTYGGVRGVGVLPAYSIFKKIQQSYRTMLSYLFCMNSSYTDKCTQRIAETTQCLNSLRTLMVAHQLGQYGCCS